MSYQPRNLLVTGGAGFIGSNFVRYYLEAEPESRIVTLDALTYAGHLANLEDLPGADRHHFAHGDICNRALVDHLLREHAIDTVVHFAAESHVDRSITGPGEFIRTNVVGTYTLLEAARHFWIDEQALSGEDLRTRRRFHHVSTDEVYGSLGPDDPAFVETRAYEPNSPYSASKAGSDHLARAWFHTYALPVTTTNCSNNYGPYHFPEKLIPLCIVKALSGEPLPVYGDGLSIRDWLFVVDHAVAVRRVLLDGQSGETYNVGGGNEKRNIDVVREICALLDRIRPRGDGRLYSEQIRFVTDRPGHDRRYAINATKISRELGWVPAESFSSGLEKTVRWYVNNLDWLQRLADRDAMTGHRSDLVSPA